MKDALLQYYEAELRALKKQGSVFANRHPELAGKLGVEAGETRDPAVQTLMEAFAFHAARIHLRFDHDQKNIPRSLIQLLYPESLLPHPAYTMLEITPDASFAQAQKIPKETLLMKQHQDRKVKFQTGFEMTLLPLKITSIHYATHFDRPTPASEKARACLRVTCELREAANSFRSAGIQKLSFYLQGEARQYLYEILHRHLLEIHLSSGDHAVSLAPRHLASVGFSETEALLPGSAQSFSGYRILTEYFAYPEKFFFVDLVNLEQVLSDLPQRALSLHFYFDFHDEAFLHKVDQESLKLNTVPVINLFPGKNIMVHRDLFQGSHHLVADSKSSPEFTEIYQVKSIVVKKGGTEAPSVECLPYFAYQKPGKAPPLYWFEKRESASALGYDFEEGEEVFLSFSDFSELSSRLENQVLMLDTLCMNRNWQKMPEFFGSQLPWQFGDQNLENIKKITGLMPVILPRYRKNFPTDEIALLSHLVIHQLGTEPQEILKVLKSILSLYDRNQRHRFSESLMSAVSEKISVRHPEGLKQGFCQGKRISLTFSENRLPPYSLFLFGSVFQNFFQKMTSLNTCFQLVIKSFEQQEEYVWPLYLGMRTTV